MECNPHALLAKNVSQAMLVKHYSSSTRTFTLTCDKAAAMLTSTRAGGLKCVTSAGGAAELSVLKCVTSTGALEQQHYQSTSTQMWSSRAAGVLEQH